MNVTKRHDHPVTGVMIKRRESKGRFYITNS